MVSGQQRAACLLALSVGLALGGCASGRRYGPSSPLQLAAGDHPIWESPKLQALLARFVRQETDTSCSVAAVSTVLGAALLQRGRPPLRQQEVLAADSTGSWARATGDAHASGTTLERLALYTLAACQRAGLRQVGVDVVHLTAANADSRASLVHNLELSQRLPHTHYLIINFLQSTYIGDGEAVGHMSVVGAYDAAKQRALVLDVDNRMLQPYWVPLHVLLAGMHTADDETGEPRGYLVVRMA